MKDYIGSEKMTPKLSPMTIRVDDHLRSQLREYAFKKGEFLYKTCERLIKIGLQKEKENQNG